MMDIIRLFKGKVDITWHYILGMGKTNNQKSPYFYGILTSRLQKTVEEKSDRARMGPQHAIPPGVFLTISFLLPQRLSCFLVIVLKEIM